MRSRFLTTISLVATMAFSQATYAIPVFLDYTYSNGTTMFGSLEGEVQSDGDTVLITAAYEVEYLGQSLDMSDFFVGYWSEIQSLPPLPIPAGPGEGVISFSGDTMDFLTCDLTLCGLGVLFSAPPFIGDAVVSLPGVFVTEFSFIQDNWNLTLGPSAVAEPNTLLLFVSGYSPFQ